MKRIYINDIITNIVIILVCISVPICFSLLSKGDEKKAEVSVDGEIIKEMPLTENGTLDVEGLVIKIENGKVRVVESDCPDRLCMKMKDVDNVGDSIICIPNKVSVRIVGIDENEGADVVAG